MNYYEELKNMLPEELETIQKMVTELLSEIVNMRITNINYQMKNKKITCIKCKSNYIVKNGKKNGMQKYWCKSCDKHFLISSQSLTSHSKLSYKQLCDFFTCLLNYNTIKETSKIVGISKTETYYIRIKVLSILNKYQSQKLHGEIQCDEKYIRLSFKGTKKDKMPRDSHRSGSDNRTSGISDEQVCVLMAIDSYDNIFAEVIGLGPITTKQLEKHLSGKIEDGSILTTDSKSSYIKFANKHSLILKQIPTKKHKTEDGYHLGELNQLMSDLEFLLIKSKGISTRHLQQYLDLFRARKILNYTFEYLNQNKELYEFSLLQTENLTCRNVCKTTMPIDLINKYDKPFE